MGDEASARGLLVEMQSRLGRDPHEALGLNGSPTAGDVRNAFLTLTKQFHPAKFARMAPEIQRLANEVFLSLRAAHDNLSRVSVTPPTRKSGPLPTLQQLRASTQLNPNPGRPASALPTTPMPTTTPSRTPNAQQPTQPMRPFTQQAKPTTGPTPRATDADPRRLAQPSPPPGQQRPPTSPTTRAPSPSPAASRPATSPGGDPLVPVLELIKLGQLAAARVALETLTARSPNTPRYQALLHYARGREAQIAKRIDEARVELQDALQIDPDLALAKTALAELFTRRR